MGQEITNKLDSSVRDAEFAANESRKRFESAADHLSEKVEGTAQSLGKAKDILSIPKHLIDEVKASANRMMESDYAKKVKENPTPYIAGAAVVGILAIAGTIYFMRRRRSNNILQIAARKLGDRLNWDM